MEVVVDHSHRLHEGITSRRTDKRPAATFQVFAQSGRVVGESDNFGSLLPAGAAAWFETPKIGCERTEFDDQSLGESRVVDGRFDFASMPDDSFVEEQLLDFWFSKIGNFVEIEVAECLPKRFPLFEDGDPAQAGLKSFEGNFFEKSVIVVDRKTPFAIVVGYIEGVRTTPPATSGLVVIDIQICGAGFHFASG